MNREKVLCDESRLLSLVERLGAALYRITRLTNALTEARHEQDETVAEIRLLLSPPTAAGRIRQPRAEARPPKTVADVARATKRMAWANLERHSPEQLHIAEQQNLNLAEAAATSSSHSEAHQPKGFATVKKGSANRHSVRQS